MTPTDPPPSGPDPDPPSGPIPDPPSGPDPDPPSGPAPELSAGPAAVLDLRRIAVPAFGPSVLAAVGQGAVLPVVALRARELGASVGVAAFAVALISVGTLVAALPAGSLVARVGEHRALMTAAVLDALAMVGAWLASSLWALGAALVAMGVASAVFNLARQAYLTDAVPLAMRARALSTLGGVTRIGLFAGPFAGAAAIQTWGIRAAYAVGLAASLATFALLVATRDLTAGSEVTSPAGAAVRPQQPVARVLRAHRHTLLTLGTGVLGVAAARASRVSIIPLWAEHVGLSAATISLVFGVAAGVDMLLFYPAGSVMDRFGRVWIAVPSVTVLGIGMLLLPLASTAVSVGAVAVVMAIGNGIGSGLVMVLGADASPVEARAQFLGGVRLFAELGGMASPLVISVVTLVGPLALASVAMGALSLVGAAWLARWVPRHPAPEPAPAP
jgi:MFS family permease